MGVQADGHFNPDAADHPGTRVILNIRILAGDLRGGGSSPRQEEKNNACGNSAHSVKLHWHPVTVNIMVDIAPNAKSGSPKG